MRIDARIFVVVALTAVALAAPASGAGFIRPVGNPHADAVQFVQAAVASQARAIQGVNVRTGPGGEYATIGTLQGGQIVGIAECTPFWCRLSDGRGWVARSYLALGSEPASVGRAATIAAAAPTPFTGVWTVRSVAVSATETYAPFQLAVAQAGEAIEGIAPIARLEGTVRPDGRAAAVTLTTPAGRAFRGTIELDGSGDAFTGVIEMAGLPILVWTGTRNAPAP